MSLHDYWTCSRDKNGGSRDISFRGRIVAREVHGSDAAQIVDFANTVATPEIERLAREREWASADPSSSLYTKKDMDRAWMGGHYEGAELEYDAFSKFRDLWKDASAHVDALIAGGATEEQLVALNDLRQALNEAEEYRLTNSPLIKTYGVEAEKKNDDSK
jgi:hypothetical protein